MTQRTRRQRIGVVTFTAGGVTTVAWGVGALLTLFDFAIGAWAPTYVPWLVAGVIPLAIAVMGVLLYGGLPRVTLRTGCIAAAWGAGLFFFVIGIEGMLQAADNVRLGGPSYQAKADVLIWAAVFELVLTLGVAAGIALWRQRWFPTLVAGAAMVFSIGLLDTIFIAMASAPF